MLRSLWWSPETLPCLVSVLQYQVMLLEEMAGRLSLIILEKLEKCSNQHFPIHTEFGRWRNCIRQVGRHVTWGIWNVEICRAFSAAIWFHIRQQQRRAMWNFQRIEGMYIISHQLQEFFQPKPAVERCYCHCACNWRECAADSDFHLRSAAQSKAAVETRRKWQPELETCENCRNNNRKFWESWQQHQPSASEWELVSKHSGFVCVGEVEGYVRSQHFHHSLQRASQPIRVELLDPSGRTRNGHKLLFREEPHPEECAHGHVPRYAPGWHRRGCQSHLQHKILLRRAGLPDGDWRFDAGETWESGQLLGVLLLQRGIRVLPCLQLCFQRFSGASLSWQEQKLDQLELARQHYPWHCKR